MARTAKVPEYISAMITTSQRERLDAIALRDGMAVSEVLRDVLEAGLPVREQVAATREATTGWAARLGAGAG
jgi:hypothetical protein